MELDDGERVESDWEASHHSILNALLVLEVNRN
jgi:hypothetical protein